MDERVSVELSEDEALVLLECLKRAKPADGDEVVDQAEQRVLWDLETTLERQLSALVHPDYSPLVAEARERVRDSTD